MILFRFLIYYEFMMMMAAWASW